MKIVVILGILGVLAVAFKMMMGRSKAPSRPDNAARAKRRERANVSSTTVGARQPAQNPVTETGGKVNWLIGMGGDVAGKRYHVGQRNITLGRAPTNYIQTTDEKASRQHCQIKPEASGIRVTDMASSNGTTVNGEGIQSVLLKDGDTLEVGQATFVFRRAVDFATDDGMARKEIGSAVNEATSSAQSLQAIIAETLEGTGGDVAKAAQVLGIDEDFIRTVSKMD